jgi:ABC-type branched-subunit amino acid transport system substrate-binding protein
MGSARPTDAEARQHVHETGVVRSYLPVLLALFCGCASPAGGGEVAVGAALPFTGVSAQRGVNIERALLGAVERVNESGGAAGRMLRLETVDTHSTTREGVAAVEPLLSAADVAAVIGPDNSDLALSLAPLAHDAHRLIVTPSATTREVALRDAERANWLRLNPSVSQLAQKLAEQIIADDRRHILLVHGVDSLTVTLHDLIIHHLVADAVTRVPASVALPDERFPDNTALLDALAQGGEPFDAIVVLTYPDKAAGIVNDAVLSYAPARRKELNWYFGHTVHSPEFLAHVLNEYVEGGVGVTLAVGSDAAAFRAEFLERWYGEEPTEEAYYYVDALNLLSLAIQATGVDEHGIVRAGLGAQVRKLTTPGGRVVHWNELAAGMAAIARGEAVTYRGLTGDLELLDDEFQRKSVSTSMWRIEKGRYVAFVP